MFAAIKLLSPQNYVCRDKIFLSRQTRVCRDKSKLVAAKCRDKHIFVTTKDVFRRGKHVFVATKMKLVAAPASDTEPLFITPLRIAVYTLHVGYCERRN